MPRLKRPPGAAVRLVAFAVLGVASLAACQNAPTGGATGTSTSRPGLPSSPAATGTASASSASGSTSSGGATPTAAAPTSAAPPAPPAGAGLPTSAELSAARADVAALGDRELAGQVIVGRYPGVDPRAAADLVARLRLAGVVVFGDNVPPDTDAVLPAMRAVADQVQATLRAQGRSWPAVVAVDQEGGPVARLGSPFTEFPAGMAYGAAGRPELAQAVAKASGQELRAAGFTMVLAPDIDVTSGPDDPTIGARSPGADPAGAAAVGAALVAGYNAAGIVSTAKHFPGHGTVTTDTHLGPAVQPAPLATLRARDWVPFQQAISVGAPAVMAAHITVRAIDATLPTTLSGPMLTGVLREQLGFRGLIVTDALEMSAVTGQFGSGRAAVLALQAGADTLIMPADPKAAIDGVVAALQRGQLPRQRLLDAAARLVATMRHAEQADVVGGTVGTAYPVAKALTDASVTQVSGRCGAPLVGAWVSVSGATEQDRARFTASARKAGLGIGSGPSVVLLGGGGYNAGSGTGSGASSGSGDLVVALDAPYGLSRSSATIAKLAVFGRTPATFDSLVAVLQGRAPAPGHLPVPVGSLPVGAGCGH